MSIKSSKAAFGFKAWKAAPLQSSDTKKWQGSLGIVGIPGTLSMPIYMTDKNSCIVFYSSLHEDRFWSFEASKSFRHKLGGQRTKAIIYSFAILDFIAQNRVMFHNKFLNT